MPSMKSSCLITVESRRSASIPASTHTYAASQTNSSELTAAIAQREGRWETHRFQLRAVEVVCAARELVKVCV